MTNNLNGDLIKGSDMNAVREQANGMLDVAGATTTQWKGQRTIALQQKPWARSAFTSTGGWNPWLWTPTVIDLSVAGTDATVKTVLSVDNCACMLGRAPYDFGSLQADNNEVLSGYVFAVIQHPIWGTNYYDVSAVLSSADTFAGLEDIDSNFSILPLYYVDSTGITKDFRGIPTMTMYS